MFIQQPAFAFVCNGPKTTPCLSLAHLPTCLFTYGSAGRYPSAPSLSIPYRYVYICQYLPFKTYLCSFLPVCTLNLKEKCLILHLEYFILASWPFGKFLFKKTNGKVNFIFSENKTLSYMKEKPPAKYVLGGNLCIVCDVTQVL